jgi:hypothetical protein
MRLVSGDVLEPPNGQYERPQRGSGDSAGGHRWQRAGQGGERAAAQLKRTPRQHWPSVSWAPNGQPVKLRVPTTLRRKSFGCDQSASHDLASAGLAHWKVTPISISLRHTRRQRRVAPSNGSANVKRSGIPLGLVTSSAAPSLDRLRTKHETVRP